MKPPLTFERLLPFVAEAAHRFAMECDVEDMTRDIVEHLHNPSHFRKNDRAMAIYNRAILHEHKDFERRDLEEYMASKDDCVWVAVQIRTANSCRLAQDVFGNGVWRPGEPLPILPMTGCTAPWCQCSYRPLSRRDASKLGL